MRMIAPIHADDCVWGLPERKLLGLAVVVGRVWVDEHLAEDVEEHVDHDRVACEFVLCRVADSSGLYLVDVLIVHSHEAEALAGCQLADSKLFAPQLRGQFDCVMFCHIRFVFNPCR